MRNLKKFNSQESYNAYILTDDAVSPIVTMYDNILNYYKKQDIPLKYKPLQYIRSTQTGGQYIDTGIGLFDTIPINFRIDMNFMMYGHGKTGTQQSTILCASLEASSYPGLNIRTGADNTYLIECVYKEAQNYEDESKDKDNRYRCKMYDVNGTTIYDSPPNNYIDARNYLCHIDREFNFSASQSHNVTTSLFCSKNGSGNTWRFMDAKLDYCKLYKNGTLVRDFVPCINLEGIAGLYDKVTKHFYKSQGNEEFVAGPSI